VALKKSNPRLKVLLAVGGWRAGSAPFVAIVDSASTRRTFANNAAKFVRQHGFDGLDVDWEFPGSRGSGPEHKALFTQLLKVRCRLNPAPPVTLQLTVDIVNEVFSPRSLRHVVDLK